MANLGEDRLFKQLIKIAQSRNKNTKNIQNSIQDQLRK
jgi:hypothetical protein